MAQNSSRTVLPFWSATFKGSELSHAAASTSLNDSPARFTVSFENAALIEIANMIIAASRNSFLLILNLLSFNIK
ncbi:MAG TPA: hypothetical protein DC017_15910 [Candidatus Wallbacteria bacterium]|nr:hypothetical protein [Candidatus Wallbacteria bacterium]